MEPRLMDTEELRRLALEHLWMESYQWNDMAAPGGLRIFVKGEGCRVTDIDGRQYLDAQSAMWLKNVGYGRKETADAAYAQMQNLTYMPANSTTIPTIKLAAKLAAITPGNLSKVFLVSGGSEANETALKMAKQYQVLSGFTKRYGIITTRGAYHGGSFATINLGSWPRLVAGSEPSMVGVRTVAHPYCYRCEFDLEYPSCNLQCAKDVERVIKFEEDRVAAFLSAPVVQGMGCPVAPPEYWPMIRSICDKYGVLLIDDEVVTGFGRTGKWFGIEHWGVVPDIMTMAKGITSGELPGAAAIAREEIAAKFVGGESETFRHVFTFGGHPVVCAVALANIEIIEKEKLVENADVMGKYLFDQLQTLYKHPMVGDIRGIGLMYGVELVKDRKTKEKFGSEEKIADRLTEKFLSAGIIMRGGRTGIVVLPPLIISKQEIDEIIEATDNAIGEIEKELSIT